MEIKITSTICKNCIFAKYEGDTQVGCSFGITDKVKKHEDFDLIEAKDDEKEFFILDGKICPYQRTSSWLYANHSDPISKVKEEVYLRWAAIVFSNGNLEDVKKTISNIMNQEHPPIAISVISYTQDKLEDLMWYLNEIIPVWYTQYELDENTPKRFSIDVAFDKLKKHRFMFYAVFNTGEEVDKNFYKKIHKYTIDDINTYAVIKSGDSLHQMIVSKILHLKYNGNSFDINLENKIIKEGENYNKYIIEYKTI